MPIKHLREILPSAKKVKEMKRRRWKSLAMAAGVFVLGAGLIGFFVLAIALAWYGRDLPSPNALIGRDVAQSTKIYDKTGQTLLYELHGDEKRTLVAIKDIPDNMKWATISIEDKGFYTHHGVYWRGWVRAFVMSILKGQRIQGTSTLTQQFVKNAILTNERSITRKLKELLLSMQIERKYSKDEILQMYLNEVPYGSMLFGVESAAQGYFGKSIKDVSLDEAALLAAIPQRPDYFNPYGQGVNGDNREALVARQRRILDLMAEQKYVTKEEAEAAKQVNTLEKLIPKQVGNIKAPHFVMMVREMLVEEYGQRLVETGGLKVTTSLDWDLQQKAEEAVRDGVDKNGPKYGFTNASLVAEDPKTGQIVAMVGSHDFFDEEHDGQVNVALRPRQPGSSFKPIVYAAGFMKGYLPQTKLWDVKTNFTTDGGKAYTPANYNGKENGPVSIRQALQGSLNIPAVEMLYLVGTDTALNLAEQMGYTTFGDRSRFGLAIVLGGAEVKLLDHVGGYATFADEGIYRKPVSILKVERQDGEVLQEWKPDEGTRVFDPQIARLVSNVLSDDPARAYMFGAGSALTLPGRPVAAKSGTTNDYHDAWLMGYTPSLVSGVWAGNNNNDEMKHGGGGSMAAAPIWQQFMKAALKDTPVEQFAAPAPTTVTKSAILGNAFERTVKIDTVTGKLAVENTPPENIQEQSYLDPHSILYYVDKNDPLGPEPSNPANDPAFGAWESAVKAWVDREGWNASSTIPTEYDDVHTKDNVPMVSLVWPGDREQIESRSFTIQADVSASRMIQSVRALMNGYVVGSSFSASEGGRWTIQAAIPNAVDRGFQDLVIEARDDVGNKGETKVTINLRADATKVGLVMTDPKPGDRLTMDALPKTVSISVDDVTDFTRADLYIETPRGETKLIGSEIKPTKSPIAFNWAYVEGPGSYTLHAEATKESGEVIRGDAISVIVAPKKLDFRGTSSTRE
jgi:penicillin-binding protein 1C